MSTSTSSIHHWWSLPPPPVPSDDPVSDDATTPKPAFTHSIHAEHEALLAMRNEIRQTFGSIFDDGNNDDAIPKGVLDKVKAVCSPMHLHRLMGGVGPVANMELELHTQSMPLTFDNASSLTVDCQAFNIDETGSISNSQLTESSQSQQNSQTQPSEPPTVSNPPKRASTRSLAKASVKRGEGSLEASVENLLGENYRTLGKSIATDLKPTPSSTRLAAPSTEGLSLAQTALPNLIAGMDACTRFPEPHELTFHPAHPGRTPGPFPPHVASVHAAFASHYDTPLSPTECLVTAQVHRSSNLDFFIRMSRVIRKKATDQLALMYGETLPDERPTVRRCKREPPNKGPGGDDGDGDDGGGSVRGRGNLVLYERKHPGFTFRLQEEVFLLGSHTLADLADMIDCRHDSYRGFDFSENPCFKTLASLPTAKQHFPYRFFYINGSFYEDKRFVAPGIDSHAKVIADWLITRSKSAVGGYRGLPVVRTVRSSGSNDEIGDMSTTRLDSLRVGWGKATSAFVHLNGHCEHMVVFGDCRLVKEDDCKERKCYPFLNRYRGQALNYSACMACLKEKSHWLVMNSPICPAYKSNLCDFCLKTLHYDCGKDAEGREIYTLREDMKDKGMQVFCTVPLPTPLLVTTASASKKEKDIVEEKDTVEVDSGNVS